MRYCIYTGGVLMCKAVDVAQHMINYSQQAEVPVDYFMLQKMCYLAQGYSLANNDAPLFREEILAWKCGPAIKEIANAFSMFGDDSIIVEVPDLKPLSDQDNESISYIVSYCKRNGLKSSDLISATSQQQIFVDAYNGSSRSIIGQHIIKNYFKLCFDEIFKDR